MAGPESVTLLLAFILGVLGFLAGVMGWVKASSIEIELHKALRPGKELAEFQRLSEKYRAGQ